MSYRTLASLLDLGTVFTGPPGWRLARGETYNLTIARSQACQVDQRTCLSTAIAMKFQPDQSDAQTITGYGPGWVGDRTREKITHSVLVGSRGERFDWDCARFEELTRALRATGAVQCRSGDLRQRRAHPLSAAGLARSRDRAAHRPGDHGHAAACRTYNVLARRGPQCCGAAGRTAPDSVRRRSARFGVNIAACGRGASEAIIPTIEQRHVTQDHTQTIRLYGDRRQQTPPRI